MDEYTITYLFMLQSIGIVAGVINTMAGGGSNLTLPMLMVTGMPADVANATNRVGVILQCLVAVKGFHKHQALDLQDALPIVLPTLVGSLIGAGAAAILPADLLKPLLLITMLGVALLILVRPSTVAPPEGTRIYRVKERPWSVWVLFLAGVYGGFVQAGVGFILIAALAGSLRYDLLRTNALKVLITAALTAVALVIFIVDDLVRWVPGLVLASGCMIGAYIGVKFAVKMSQRLMKWFLFVMTLCCCIAVMWF